MGFPEARALDDLVPNVGGEEDGDVDVRDEEIGRAEVEEHREAVDEDEEGVYFSSCLLVSPTIRRLGLCRKNSRTSEAKRNGHFTAL